MGLDISVGYLAKLNQRYPDSAEAFREEIQRLNVILSQYGLEAHREPEHLPEFRLRAEYDGFSYSLLHYLRRIYAHVKRDPNWQATPLEVNLDIDKDPVLKAEYAKKSSHLLHHSDMDGYYVPQDFRDVIDASCTITGGMLGSSQQLLQELIEIAPAMGITLENGDLSDVEAQRIIGIGKSEEPLNLEYSAWLPLFEAARLSIKHNTLIVFS
jgi:hypothetical protein